MKTVASLILIIAWFAMPAALRDAAAEDAIAADGDSQRRELAQTVVQDHPSTEVLTDNEWQQVDSAVDRALSLIHISEPTRH